MRAAVIIKLALLQPSAYEQGFFKMKVKSFDSQSRSNFYPFMSIPEGLQGIIARTPS